MTGVAVRRPLGRTVAVAVGAAVLGVLAFMADAVDGMAGQIVVAAPGSPDSGFIHGVGAAQLVEALVPLAVLAWLATVRRLWRAWPILLIATILTATLGALCWHLLRTAADQLG